MCNFVSFLSQSICSIHFCSHSLPLFSNFFSQDYPNILKAKFVRESDREQLYGIQFLEGIIEMTITDACMAANHWICMTKNSHSGKIINLLVRVSIEREVGKVTTILFIYIHWVATILLCVESMCLIFTKDKIIKSIA